MRPKGSKKELEERRMRAAGFFKRGLSLREIARRLGVTGGAVAHWKKAYKRAGKDGLRAKRHPGAKPKLSYEDRRLLPDLLRQGPRAHGFPTELWTLKRVKELIKRRFDVSYETVQVWRILREIGWSCQKPERQARERDEEAIRRWREVEWPNIKKKPAEQAEA